MFSVAPMTELPCFFPTGIDFPRQHGFVHSTPSLDNNTIHGDRLTGLDKHHVTNTHIIHGHVYFLSRGKTWAVLARSPINFLIASEVRPLARASRNFPSLISVMMTAAVS